MNSENDLVLKQSNPACTLYEIESSKYTHVRRFIASTPQTRAISNNPLICGVRYTESLEDACKSVFSLFGLNLLKDVPEQNVCVLNILRGGLNFGIREALARALGWNRHLCSFISAQRRRSDNDSTQWSIIEGDYIKHSLPDHAHVIFADVVATGTSLEYGLNSILDEAARENRQIDSLLFLTIGGKRSEELLEKYETIFKSRFPDFKGASVVYFEGRFKVPDDTTPLSIKITGTDLVRRDSLMAPEFIESQYEKPTYPLERCTIYDAGSRAYAVNVYLADVLEYWENTLELASKGTSFEELLMQRCPLVSANNFGQIDLAGLCKTHIEALEALL